MRVRRRARTILWVVGIPQLIAGLWAFVAPARWFRSFPGFGLEWVSSLGPYNEHLAVDVGSLLTALGLLLVLAGYVLDRRVVQLTILVQLVFALPHFVYHLFAISRQPAAAGLLQILVLGVQVVLPLWLLRSARRL
jgi:hypothetical protein